MNRTLRTLIIYGMSIILVAILFSWWFDQVSGPEEIPISDFVANVEQGDYSEVVLLGRSHQAQGRLKGTVGDEVAFDHVASYVEGFEQELTTRLENSGTAWSTDPEPPGFWELLISFLPWLFLLGFMVFIFMQMQGGGNRVMQFGKSRVEQTIEDSHRVFRRIVALFDPPEQLVEGSQNRPIGGAR